MRTCGTPRCLTVALVALLLGAAGCDRHDAVQPPTLHLGEDVCAHCGMIVSDVRFAAACVVDQAGVGYAGVVFDDVGCLLDYDEQVTEQRIVQRYVMDYQIHTWLKAEDAIFVSSRRIHAPMASGVIACGMRADADALAQQYGAEQLDYPQVAAMRAAGVFAAPPGGSAAGHLDQPR